MNNKMLVEKYFELEEVVYKRICERFYRGRMKNASNGKNSNTKAKEETLLWADDAL